MLSLLGPCQLLSIFVSVWNSRYPSSSHGRASGSPGVSLLLPAPSGTAPGGGSARQQGGAGGTMGALRWVWLSRVPQWHHGTSTACVQDAPGSAMSLGGTVAWPRHVSRSFGAQHGVLPCARAQHPFPLGSSCHLRDCRVAGGTGPARGPMPGQPGTHGAGAAGGGTRSMCRLLEPDSCLISQARAGGGWKVSRGRRGQGWNGHTLPALHRRGARPRRRAGAPRTTPCCLPRTARRGLLRQLRQQRPPAIPPSSSGSSW